MRVLMACAAVSPLVNDGGVAEGVRGLSEALAGLGCAVTVAVPRARGMEAGELVVGRGVRVQVLDAGEAPETVWGDDACPSSAAYFGRFCQAVVRHVEEAPYAVLHAHDWQAAPSLYLLARRLGPRVAAVLTIHNLIFQGTFERGCAAALGLAEIPRPFEFDGRINFLKAGIVAADRVLTVSPSYAREIVTPQGGELLDRELAARRPVGIANGIDTTLWDPARDPAIRGVVTRGERRGKEACKRALLDELGIAERHAPLVVSLGRIDAQKGSDVLAEAAPGLAARGATLVVAGKGDPLLAAELRARTRYLGFVSEERAHRLMAAADLVVMPSRFEPCGVVQLYAQRYGALPVVRRTGGLVDTVIDGETGVLFGEVSAASLLGAVDRALAMWRDPGFGAMQERMMRLPLGWGRAAQEHRMLYAHAKAPMRGPELNAWRPEGAR